MTTVYPPGDVDPDVSLKFTELVNFEINPEDFELATVTVRLSRDLTRYEAHVARRDLEQSGEPGDAYLEFNRATRSVTLSELVIDDLADELDNFSNVLAELEKQGAEYGRDLARARKQAQDALTEFFSR